MSGNTRVIRASNKDTHPGRPDIDEEVMGRPIPKPRRTKAQITADNEAATKKKTSKAAEVKLNNERRAQLKEQIATLEKQMRDEEEQADKEAAHPPVKKMVLLVTKPPSSKGTNTHLFKCAVLF
jgi:hypothetical protein